jgi:hypothetical protein
MSLAIQIHDNQTAFSPRGRITGEVSWQLETPPQSVELRLVWGTSGRGNLDFCVVETMPFPNPQPTESRSFAFTLPEGPYSFSGKFIALTWALELAIEPGRQLVGQEITVAPGGREVVLPQIAKK